MWCGRRDRPLDASRIGSCALLFRGHPVVAEGAGMWAFAFFALMMAVQLVWAVFFMPETKGGTIEDIEERLGVQ